MNVVISTNTLFFSKEKIFSLSCSMILSAISTGEDKSSCTTVPFSEKSEDNFCKFSSSFSRCTLFVRISAAANLSIGKCEAIETHLFSKLLKQMKRSYF